MPPRGFKAITVPEELYRDIKEFFQRERKSLMKKGIRSLPTWITVILYKEMGEYASRKKAPQDPKALEKKLTAILGPGAETILKYMLEKKKSR